MARPRRLCSQCAVGNSGARLFLSQDILQMHGGSLLRNHPACSSVSLVPDWVVKMAQLFQASGIRTSSRSLLPGYNRNLDL